MTDNQHVTVMICAECGTEIIYEIGTKQDASGNTKPYIKAICPTCDNKGSRAVCFATQKLGYNVFVNVNEMKMKLN